MSRKLTRHLEDIERTERKMAELQAHLEAIRQSQKADEDAEIVRSVRSMNLKGWDLINLLEGIQSGTVQLRPVEESSVQESTLTKKNRKKEDSVSKDTGSISPDKNEQAQNAPESEDYEHE